MNQTISVTVLAGLLGILGAVRVAPADERVNDTKNAEQPARPASHTATGVVKAVKPESGQVTLQHGPVPSLNWPSMTMAFGVQDRAMLDQLEPGRKVEFEFVRQGSKYVITKVR